MSIRQRNWILPPASVLLVAGVFLGRETGVFLWPFLCCISAAVSVLMLKGRLRFAACLVLSFALGFLAGCLAFHPALPPEDTYEVRGVISDEVGTGSFNQHRLYLSDVTLNGNPLRSGAYWTFYEDDENLPSGLLPGKAVSFRASLYHPSGAVNPNGYNFRDALLQRGVHVGLYGCEDLVVRENDRFSFYGWVASLRHRLSAALISSLGEETGAYASALLLGMRSLIPSEDRQAFSKLGIAHILSVSGFHVGILIALLSVLFRLLRLRPGIKLCCYAILLFLYTALCGFSQPVIRASILLLLTFCGRMLNRPRSGLHLLSAALFVMTLVSPVQVTSASFQLTFCAMFGLVWFRPLSLKAASAMGGHRLAGRVLSSLVLLLGIQLGLLFPELLFFQRLPLIVWIISIPATFVFSVLICLFWLALALVPVPGLLSIFASPLSTLTGLLLSGIRSLGTLPGLTLWIHSPTLLTGVGIVLLFAGSCLLVRQRFIVRSALLLLGAAAVAVSLLPYPHSATEYIQFSAGNADAAVLWDRDRVVVIDTGENDGVLSSFLRSRRLTPDAVILTHLHADHAGGLQSMIDDEIPVPLLCLPEGAENQQIHPDFLRLLSVLRVSGTEIITLSRGDTLSLPSGSLTVLWPEKGKVRTGQEANDYSLVSRILLKGTVLLQTGDISGTYESYCAAPADILKASHHGSPSSTGEAFLDSVSPSAVLLSCKYPERLDAFRERCGAIPVFGTAESGAVTVQFEDNRYTIIPYLSNLSTGGT